MADCAVLLVSGVLAFVANIAQASTDVFSVACRLQPDAQVEAAYRDQSLRVLEDSALLHNFSTNGVADAYRAAAQRGYPKAVYDYGRTQFSLLFQHQQPQMKEKDRYVEALSYIFVAELLNDDEARESAAVIRARQEALSELPESFVNAAEQQAQRWKRHCVSEG